MQRQQSCRALVTNITDLSTGTSIETLKSECVYKHKFSHTLVVIIRVSALLYVWTLTSLHDFAITVILVFPNLHLLYRVMGKVVLN